MWPATPFNCEPADRGRTERLQHEGKSEKCARVAPGVTCGQGREGDFSANLPTGRIRMLNCAILILLVAVFLTAPLYPLFH